MCVGVKGCELCPEAVCKPRYFGILGTGVVFLSLFPLSV